MPAAVTMYALLHAVRRTPVVQVTVVSPHLDDAALSIGGTIHKMVRAGAAVTIATIFAGDPMSTAAPSYWDAGRGATQGEAARQRRVEDDAAAAELGVTTMRLPWSDSGYVEPRDPDEIWRQLAPVVDTADVVFMPGWPLRHADHRYATLLTLQRLSPAQVRVFYAEQPYAADPVTMAKAMLRSRTNAPLRHAAGGEVRWLRSALDREDRSVRAAAVGRYAGELERLAFRAWWGRMMGALSGEWLGTDQDVSILPELGVA